tara:strand:- start:72170 stop:72955 length:786 start_codon:yes stop_codon:yes gene_type:complete
MKLSCNHYLYTGTIQHRRFTPFNHFFSYPIFLVYIDINKLDNIQKKSWIWNINKSALISFNRKDYHGDPQIELSDAVEETILKRTGKKIRGPIRLLAHLRYFGYCFNPVSFYYCFNEEDTEVEMIMAEVTNTPWNERHAYILEKSSNSKKFDDNISAELEKKLHVSPFWGMDHQYEWEFTQPKENIRVSMKNYKENNKVFDAFLHLNREPFTLKALLKLVAKFPFITMLVVFRIHWQAFKLWLKKAPFFIHPDKTNLMERM